MRVKKTDYPLELPSTVPKDKKEIREAEAKLAAMRKTKRKSPGESAPQRAHRDKL
jgi:hypothetical protein